MDGTVADSCGGSWSPIIAAVPQSALSGVLAGFVFAGIVVILSAKPEPDGMASGKNPPDAQEVERIKRYRSYALQLFATAFVILALNSYFSSITAGEGSCNRAYAETGMSGAVLGIGTVMLLTGLGWLLVTYSGRTKDLRGILTAIMCAVWLLIMVMLAISSVSIGESMLPKREHTFVNIAPWLATACMAAVIIVRAVRSRHLKSEKIGTGVRHAALASLVLAVVSSLLTGIAGAVSASAWKRPSAVIVDCLVMLSVFLPSVALIMNVPPAIGAIAGEFEPHDEENGTPHSDLGLEDGIPKQLNAPGEQLHP